MLLSPGDRLLLERSLTGWQIRVEHLDPNCPPPIRRLRQRRRENLAAAAAREANAAAAGERGRRHLPSIPEGSETRGNQASSSSTDGVGTQHAGEATLTPSSSSSHETPQSYYPQARNKQQTSAVPERTHTNTLADGRGTPQVAAQQTTTTTNPARTARPAPCATTSAATTAAGGSGRAVAREHAQRWSQPWQKRSERRAHNNSHHNGALTWGHHIYHDPDSTQPLYRHRRGGHCTICTNIREQSTNHDNHSRNTARRGTRAGHLGHTTTNTHDTHRITTGGCPPGRTTT